MPKCPVCRADYRKCALDDCEQKLINHNDDDDDDDDDDDEGDRAPMVVAMDNSESEHASSADVS